MAEDAVSVDEDLYVRMAGQGPVHEPGSGDKDWFEIHLLQVFDDFSRSIGIDDGDSIHNGDSKSIDMDFQVQ